MSSRSLILSITAVGFALALGWRSLSSAPPPAAPAAPPATTSPTLLELGSHSCSSCKAMKPVLADLQSAHKGALTVESVDVWEHREVAEQHHVRTIPTQIFISAAGEELFRHTGFLSRADIEARWAELGVELK